MPRSDQDERPAARPVPSFDSLRDPRRRSPIDLLVPIPESAPPAPEPAPEPVTEPVTAPAPRPPDYADLVRLAVHLARLSVGVPLRLACWSVRLPVRGLRRLTGG